MGPAQAGRQGKGRGGEQQTQGGLWREMGCGPRYGGHGCSLELYIVGGAMGWRRVLWIRSHLQHQCTPASIKHPSPARPGLSGHLCAGWMHGTRSHRDSLKLVQCQHADLLFLELWEDAANLQM